MFIVRMEFTATCSFNWCILGSWSIISICQWSNSCCCCHPSSWSLRADWLCSFCCSCMHVVKSYSADSSVFFHNSCSRADTPIVSVTWLCCLSPTSHHCRTLPWGRPLAPSILELKWRLITKQWPLPPKVCSHREFRSITFHRRKRGYPQHKTCCLWKCTSNKNSLALHSCPNLCLISLSRLIFHWRPWDIYRQILLRGRRSAVSFDQFRSTYHHIWTREGRISKAPCTKWSHSSRPGAAGQVCVSPGWTILFSRELRYSQPSVVYWLQYIPCQETTGAPTWSLVCWKGSTKEHDFPQGTAHCTQGWSFPLYKV